MSPGPRLAAMKGTIEKMRQAHARRCSGRAMDVRALCRMRFDLDTSQ